MIMRDNREVLRAAVITQFSNRIERRSLTQLLSQLDLPTPDQLFLLLLIVADLIKDLLHLLLQSTR